MLANNMMNTDTQPNPYLVQKIMTASPEELISYIYEAGIRACVKQDQSRALEAIQHLIDALNFEAGEVSNNFYHFYSQIQELLYKHEFVRAQNLLVELRKTWTQAMNLR